MWRINLLGTEGKRKGRNPKYDKKRSAWKRAVKWRFRFDENIARTTDDRIGRMPGVKDAIDAVARNRFIFVAL
jgi:hypothetical protein